MDTTPNKIPLFKNWLGLQKLAAKTKVDHSCITVWSGQQVESRCTDIEHHTKYQVTRTTGWAVKTACEKTKIIAHAQLTGVQGIQEVMIPYKPLTL